LFGFWPPLLIAKIEPAARQIVAQAGGFLGDPKPAALPVRPVAPKESK